MADDNATPAPTLAQQMMDRVTQARQAGYSWDDIHGYFNQRRQAAKDAGYSDDEINRSLSFVGDMESKERMTANANAAKQQPVLNIPATPQGLFDAFRLGAQGSSEGFILRQKLPDGILPADAPRAVRIMKAAGEFFGDIPAMIGGAVVGGAAGGGAGSAVAPGPGTAAGAFVGSGVGMGALPQAIKGEWRAWLEAGGDPHEFANKQASVIWDTTKAGIVSLAAKATGGLVGGGLKAAGAGAVTQYAVKTPSELAAMTATSAALEGKLPTKEEVIDNAILLAMFGVAGKAIEASPSMVKIAKANLIDNWVRTDQTPAQASQAAAQDPVLRAKLQTQPVPIEGKELPGSPKVQTQESGEFVVPRVPHTADSVIDAVMHIEDRKMLGTLTTDTGGLTKYGISSKANPDIDVARLTPIQAHQLLLDRYYKPMKIDQLPSEMQLPVFDAAVNEGVGKAREMLEASKLPEGGYDRAKFIELRRAHYRSLIEAHPEKYAKDEKSWMARLNEVANEQIRDVPKDAHNEIQKDLKEKTDLGEPGADDGNHAARISAQMAPADYGPGLRERITNGWSRFYREWFKPDQPVNQLDDALTTLKGNVPDAERPNFINRLYEAGRPDEHARRMVETEMLDINGQRTGDPSLLKILGEMKPGDEREHAMAVHLARWTLENARLGRETGIHPDDALKTVREATPKEIAWSKKLSDYRNGTLDYYHAGGMLSDEAYALAKKNNYISLPGYRVLDEETPQGRATGAKTPFQQVRKMEGSKAQVKNIVQSLLADTFIRTKLAQLNLRNSTMRDALVNLGMMQRVPGSLRKFELSDEELEKIADGKNIDENGDEMSAAIYRRVLGQGVAKDELPVFENGKVERWKITDPQWQPLMDYLKSTDVQTRSMWEKVLGKVTRFEVKNVTINPHFAANIFRYDMIYQAIANPHLRNTFMDFLTGLKAFSTNSVELQKVLRQGAGQSIFTDKSYHDWAMDVLRGQEHPDALTPVRSMWNAVKTPFHAMQVAAKVMTSSQSVGASIRDMRAGSTDIRAAVQRTNSVFHGPWFGGYQAKRLNALDPFFTAQLATLDRVARNALGYHVLRAMGDSGKDVMGEKYSAPHFWATGAALITVPMLAQWYENKDKPWYKRLSDWDKYNAFHFNVGSDDDENAHIVPMPLPPVLSLIFGGIPSMLAQRIFEGDKHAFDGAWKDALGSVAPTSVAMGANVFLPIIEHVANYSFFRGSNLVSDSAKQSLAPDQENPYTTQLAKSTSRLVNEMPIFHPNIPAPVVDNYLQHWASLAENAARMYNRISPKRDNAEKPQLEDWPFLNQFLSRHLSAASAPIKNFSDDVTKFNQVHGSLITAMKDNDFTRFKQLVDENPTAAVAHAFAMRGQPEIANLPREQLDRFVDYLQKDVPNFTADKQEAMAGFVEKTKIMTLQRKLVRDIASRPATGENALSPQDKRQLLDRLYSAMAVNAERGTKLGQQAGLQ